MQAGAAAELPKDMVHHAPSRANAAAVGGVLADDMGLGKTLSMVYAVLAARQAVPEQWPTLVVTPKSLLHQWAAQIATHVVGGADLVHVHDGASTRAPLVVHPRVAFVLVTYDNVKNAWLHRRSCTPGGSRTPRGALARITWSRVILDEADTVRNASTQVSRAVQALKARARWCLTGTPLNNSISDVAALAQYIGIAPYCHKSYWAPSPRGGAIVQVGAMQAWGRRFVLRRRAECLELPPLHTTQLPCPLSPAEDALYCAVREAALEDFRASGDGSVVLSAITRLRQVCVCSSLALGLPPPSAGTASRARSRRYALAARPPPVLADTPEVPDCTPCTPPSSPAEEGSDDEACAGGPSPEAAPQKALACRVPVPSKVPSSSRIKRLLQYIHTALDEDATARFIVFSQWTSALAHVSAALHAAGIGRVQVDGSISVSAERAARVQRFTGSLQRSARAVQDTPVVLLLALHAGAKGLDLSVANHVCVLDGWYNPAVLAQAVKRAHRLGQTRPVNVVHFYAPGTIEEAVGDICSNKAALSKYLMNDAVASLEDSAVQVASAAAAASAQSHSSTAAAERSTSQRQAQQQAQQQAQRHAQHRANAVRAATLMGGATKRSRAAKAYADRRGGPKPRKQSRTLYAHVMQDVRADVQD